MLAVRQIYSSSAQDNVPTYGYSNNGYLARRERDISTLTTCAEIASAFFYDAVRGNRVAEYKDLKELNFVHLAVAAYTALEVQINDCKHDEQVISTIKTRNANGILNAIDRHWPGLRTFEGLIHAARPANLTQTWATARASVSSRATRVLDNMVQTTSYTLPRWMMRDFNDKMALFQYELSICFNIDPARLQLFRAFSGFTVPPVPPYVRNAQWGDI